MTLLGGEGVRCWPLVAGGAARVLLNVLQGTGQPRPPPPPPKNYLVPNVGGARLRNLDVDSVVTASGARGLGESVP